MIPVPEKLVPFMDTVVPVEAEVGVIETIVGVGMKENPAKLAVPPVVVTVTLPVAPEDTTAVMVVLFTMLKLLAVVPPKETELTVTPTPVKLVPVIVTVPLNAVVLGVNELMVGEGINVNPAKFAVPAVVVTDKLPVVPEATTAVIVVLLTTVKLLAAVPPNFNALTLTPEPVKFVPEIVIVAPDAAEVGEKEPTVGVGRYTKPPILAVPPEVITVTLPEVAPVGTTAVM